jgi:hypothetical protein
VPRDGSFSIFFRHGGETQRGIESIPLRLSCLPQAGFAALRELFLFLLPPRRIKEACPAALREVGLSNY